MRQALFVVALLGVFAAVAMAEEWPLQSVDRPAVVGEMRCMPFFVVTTFGGRTMERIVFSYQVPNGETKRDTVAKTRALVQVREGQPTYEKTSVGGEDRALFRLNQADYERARACLPLSEPEAAQ